MGVFWPPNNQPPAPTVKDPGAPVTTTVWRTTHPSGIRIYLKHKAKAGAFMQRETTAVIGSSHDGTMLPVTAEELFEINPALREMCEAGALILMKEIR